MRRTLLALTVAALLVSVRAPFGQAFPRAISIRVAPASIAKTVRDGDAIGPIMVSNPGDFEVDVEGRVAEGGHDEWGVPVNRPREHASSEGVLVILEPARFRLAPGESRAVTARVRVAPGFLGGAYPVVIFQGRPADPGVRQQVVASPQVVVLTLLTVVHGGRGMQVESNAALVSVGVMQDAAGAPVKVFVTCENTGNLHAHLGAATVVRRKDGRIAAEVTMPVCVCLPGCARTLLAPVAAEPLESGAYVADVRVWDSGAEVGSALVAFRVDDGCRVASTRLDLRGAGADGPHEGPGSLRVTGLAVPAVNAGSEIPVEVRVQNAGNLDLDPVGYVEVWDYQMRRVGLVALGGERVAARSSTVFRLTWPEPLSAGYYMARATLQWGNEKRSASTAFVVGGTAYRRRG